MSIEAPIYKYVGKSVLRQEGVGKLTGRARYVDDMVVPGALTGKTLRSTIACGRIISIKFGPGIPWEQFTVVTASDLAVNRVALIEDDQPILCDGYVHHHQEAILLIAHEDAGLVERAIRSIEVEYEPQPGVFEIGEGRALKELSLLHGDWERELAASDVVFEETYYTGSQEHVYIEPNGFIAWWDENGVTLHGSHQCPYYVHKAVKTAFQLPDEQVNVIQETTGGGFGGKEDFPSLVAIHAALLSQKSGRPVRLIYDRQEDLLSSTKRHPSISVVRTGCTREGILRALDFEFRIDGGAYVTLSPVVLSRGILHACGPYRWAAARIHGKCHFTNSPPYGAFRGFGAPQSQFAMEMHLTLLAEKLGLDPAEIRRRNFLKRGDELPTGQILDEEPNLGGILDRTLAASDYDRKRRVYTRGSGHGISISAFFHGTGFTGSGEVCLKSRVAVATRADGLVEVLVASTEIGQGTETVFCQIAAEALGIPIEKMVFHRPETRVVPDSGPTVASRTCSIVGGLVEKAARSLREKLGGLSVDEHVARHGPTRAEAQFQARPGLVWDDATYKGSAYGVYSWACNVAEVSIDSVTATPRVEKLWATYDIGTVVNPVLAYGQVEGGTAQAIGWATCESVLLKEGLMQNARMTNYIIPTSADAADIHIEFAANPSPLGAFGSKGVGEIPMDGPPAAIIAAVNDAAGASLRKLPALPEDLLK